MFPPLDVFAVSDGELKWLDCADTLAKALELILEDGTGLYIVFSQETGLKNFYELTPSGTLARVFYPSEPNWAAVSPREWT